MAIILDTHEGAVNTYQEVDGKAMQYSRSVLITSLPGGTLNANIADALSQLNSAGLTYYATTAAADNLRLAERNITMIDGFDDTMRCVVVFRDQLSMPAPVGQWIGVIRSNTNQIQNANDFFGFPIFVEHTYPADDDFKPNLYEKQGGTVTQYRPQIEVNFRGKVQTSSAAKLVERYIGRMNSTTWGGLQPGQWLCTAMDAELDDPSTTPDTYAVDVTFQAEFEGWGQDVIFIDRDTGSPPANLVPGVGIKKVRTQPQTDFNALIPTI